MCIFLKKYQKKYSPLAISLSVTPSRPTSSCYHSHLVFWANSGACFRLHSRGGGSLLLISPSQPAPLPLETWHTHRKPPIPRTGPAVPWHVLRLPAVWISLMKAPKEKQKQSRKFQRSGLQGGGLIFREVEGGGGGDKDSRPGSVYNA